MLSGHFRAAKNMTTPTNSTTTQSIGIGGYQFEVVDKDSPIKDLQCVFCTGLLKDAMDLPCGHLACEICLQQFSNQRFVVC